MRKGKLYKITFLDHAVGIDRSIECVVVGWLLKQTKDYAVLSHWLVIDSDKDIVDNNVEHTTLLKSTFKEIIEL